MTKIYYYSMTTESFYPKKMLSKYDNLPNDLIEIDEETFLEYTNIKDNKKIVIKKNKLCLEDVLPSSEEQIKNFIYVMNTRTEQKIYDIIKVKYNFQNIGDYVGYPNKFRKLAEALGKWKSEMWTYTELQIELLNNGKREITLPNMYEEELPKFKEK